MTGKLS